jgi:hypothetical protein
MSIYALIIYVLELVLGMVKSFLFVFSMAFSSNPALVELHVESIIVLNY